MARPSRKDRQAHTRQCLMDSAARIFARRGLANASIDEVAADAGFTKGAFYANFRSKEELFLAMLDERFAQKVDELERLFDSEGSPVDHARAGGQEFLDSIKGDPEWERLFFEFAAHAARDERFREELVARYRTLVDRLSEGLGREAGRVGIVEDEDLRHFAVMIFAAANGIALQQLLDPESVPSDMFASMMELLTLGAIAKTQAQDPASP